jgi:hypothetical protein
MQNIHNAHLSAELRSELMEQLTHFEYIKCQDEKKLFLNGYTGIKLLSDKQLVSAMAERYDDVIYLGDWEGLWVFPYGKSYEIHRFERGCIVEMSALTFAQHASDYKIDNREFASKTISDIRGILSHLQSHYTLGYSIEISPRYTASKWLSSALQNQFENYDEYGENTLNCDCDLEAIKKELVNYFKQLVKLLPDIDQNEAKLQMQQLITAIESAKADGFDFIMIDSE